MTPPRRFMGILVVLPVLLIGLAAYGARSGTAQDGTPMATSAASPAATPQGDSACAAIGSAPVLQVVMEIDDRPIQPISAEIVDRTVSILARRAAGVSPAGCAVAVQADGSIQVTLAASPTLDADAAVDTLGGSARLEIVDTGGATPEVGTELDPYAELRTEMGVATPGIASYPVILTGGDITEADSTMSPSGTWQVGITLTEEAAARFATFTAAHIGQPLAIVLDGEVISVPVIQAEISGGQVVIAGNFTEVEAETLATQLRAGALPAPLTVVSVQLVTPDGQVEDVPIGEVDGVEIFTDVRGGHTTEPIAYPQSPPIGGMHDPAWQNCGFYSAPIRNENAVHSLEHGVVWITYQPDLPPAEVEALRQFTLVNDRLLVSPYPGLDAPIVLSTWDRQLRLDSVDDPRLFEFIDAYTNQAPEPGANCQGAVGTPG